MNYITLSSLIIPENRQRREFDPTKLWELADSILSKGLMHPPVVQEDGVTLIAGERRCKALTQLHNEGKTILFDGVELEPNIIPVVKLSNLSAHDIIEAELEENILRVDLSWQERALAIDTLHTLRTITNPEQSMTDTATEILGRKPHGGEAANLVRTNIIIAKHLDNPAVASAKSEKEAFKIVEKQIKKEHRERLSKDFKDTESKHTLTQGDSLQEMTAPEHQNKYDLIVTDPPYGMGADTFGTMAQNEHNYDDSKHWFLNNVDRISELFYRITKPQAHAYIFCDLQNFTVLVDAMTLAGWDVWRTPLVWYKGNMGMLPRPDHGPRRTYELCLYAIKGKKETQLIGAHDVIILNNEQGDKDHAAQKPPALYKELIRRSCLPGDKIIDPFCGSGPVFPAADATETIATGIELGDDAYAQAVQRLSQ